MLATTVLDVLKDVQLEHRLERRRRVNLNGGPQFEAAGIGELALPNGLGDLIVKRRVGFEANPA